MSGKMVSLKREGKRKTDEDACSPVDASLYPWGTRISLDDEALRKMGLDLKSVRVGDGLRLRGDVQVLEIAMEQRQEKGERRRLELQITRMGLERAREEFDEGWDDDRGDG
jgi:hypothetical protein